NRKQHRMTLMGPRRGGRRRGSWSPPATTVPAASRWADSAEQVLLADRSQVLREVSPRQVRGTQLNREQERRRVEGALLPGAGNQLQIDVGHCLVERQQGELRASQRSAERL